MLTEKIKSFVKIQKIKVNEFVNKEGAADAIREDDENRNWLLELEFDIDAILDILARKNLEAEKLNDERTKAFKVLGVRDDNSASNVLLFVKIHLMCVCVCALVCVCVCVYVCVCVIKTDK